MLVHDKCLKPFSSALKKCAFKHKYPSTLTHVYLKGYPYNHIPSWWIHVHLSTSPITSCTCMFVAYICQFYIQWLQAKISLVWISSFTTSLCSTSHFRLLPDSNIIWYLRMTRSYHKELKVLLVLLIRPLNKCI